MTGRPAFQLDTKSLERLLTFLGVEGSTEAWRRVHARLESFFRWKGLRDPGQLADETLDRAARRLMENAVRTEAPAAFLLGVARFVALESQRKAPHEVSAERLAVPATSPDGDVDTDRMEALEKCLGTLPAAERDVVLQYYRHDDGRQRIDSRQQLAERLGIGLNALRIKAFRLRQRLEQCVEGRLAEMEGRAAPLEGR